MPKRVIDVTSLGVHSNSLKAMINTLAGMLGDEVYVRPVLEVESSEQVLRALDAIIEGVKSKQKSKPAS
jgi:hypothetical protein